MTTMGDEDCRVQVATSEEVFVGEDGGQAADNMDTTNTLQTSSENITAYSCESLRDLDSADLSDSRSVDIDDDDNVFSVSQPTGDSKEGGSDSDSTSEGTCLGSMMSDGQDYYLRLGDTPRRRSALRLSRIIARQQLLRRLTQGRNEPVT